MPPAPYRYDESERLDLVAQLGIDATSSEPALSALATAAATICDAPISLVTVLDDSTQWFVAQVGIESSSTPRGHAFCDVAIRQPDRMLEVPDTWLDSRFKSNPLVTSSPHIRAYAGVPIRPLDHHAVGTLCIISDSPMRLSEEDRDALRCLGSVAEQLLRLRLQAQTENRRRVLALQGLAHDLAAPLASIRLTAESLATRSFQAPADQQVAQLAVFAAAAEDLLVDLRKVEHLTEPEPDDESQPVSLPALVEDVVGSIGTDKHVAVDIDQVVCRIDPRVVGRALTNLVNNASLHTSADTAITVTSRVERNDLTLVVQDSGVGLPDAVDLHIRTYGRTDQIPATPGVGLGLIVAHSLARTYGGALWLESQRGEGTRVALGLPGVVISSTDEQSPGSQTSPHS